MGRKYFISAAYITAKREARGLSKKELADALGLEVPSKVSAWEAGTYKPSDDMIKKMSIALEFSLDELPRKNINLKRRDFGELEETVRKVIRQEIHTEIKEIFQKECEDLKRFITATMGEKQKTIPEDQAPPSRKASRN